MACLALVCSGIQGLDDEGHNGSTVGSEVPGGRCKLVDTWVCAQEAGARLHGDVPTGIGAIGLQTSVRPPEVLEVVLSLLLACALGERLQIACTLCGCASRCRSV